MLVEFVLLLELVAQVGAVVLPVIGVCALSFEGCCLLEGQMHQSIEGLIPTELTDLS